MAKSKHNPAAEVEATQILARDLSNIHEWRAWFDAEYAGLDGVEAKMLLRAFIQEATTRPPIPLALRREVYKRDGYACLHCGTKDGLSLDHVHPYSLGGADTLENLQTLCKPCNSRKGVRF